MFTYWLTSNCFSLGQVALLRLPSVRDKFRIPERIKHPDSSLPQNDGFVQSMKKGGFLDTQGSTVCWCSCCARDADPPVKAGKTLSWPSSSRKENGESKTIWTWQPKVGPALSVSFICQPRRSSAGFVLKVVNNWVKYKKKSSCRFVSGKQKTLRPLVARKSDYI